MSALGPECGDRLRWSSVPGVNGHTGICVVSFEVDVTASDLDLPLVPGAGVVSPIDDFHIIDVLALQAKERLPCADISFGISEDFKVAFSKPIVAQGAVQYLKVCLAETGALGAEVVDAAEVGKGVVGRSSDGKLLFCPLRGAGVIEFCVDQAAGGNGEKCQKCNSSHGMSLGCQFVAMVSALVATVNPSKRNTAVGGVPSVTFADRGQARLQVAPNPSLSNLGRVGANCVARPAFLGVFHG